MKLIIKHNSKVTIFKNINLYNSTINRALLYIFILYYQINTIMSKLLTSIKYAASQIYPANMNLSSTSTFFVIYLSYYRQKI
jgi:hypothetical protein